MIIAAAEGRQRQTGLSFESSSSSAGNQWESVELILGELIFQIGNQDFSGNSW
jgi:hypothetical protein